VSYAIVFVSDMKRSVSFYRDMLGIPLRFETPAWTEFATDGAILALHAAESAPAGGSGPTAESAGWCRPGLSVPDLDAFHERAIAGGVPCVREPTETFGARVAKYSDPDGLVLSFSEDRNNG
jgi:lactoylglutathione lyase